MRTSGARGSCSSSARWTAAAASTAAAGVWNAAKYPSPVCLMTSPPAPSISSRSVRSCHVEELAPLLLAEDLDELRRVDDVGEHERAPGRGLAEELGRALRVQHRPEALERRPGDGELLARAVLVALAAVGEAEEHPRLRGLVRRADLVPGVAGGAKRGRGAVPVVLGEPDPPVGKLDRPLEDGRPAAVDQIVVGDRLELAEGLSGAPELARGERDLDLGRKPPASG